MDTNSLLARIAAEKDLLEVSDIREDTLVDDMNGSVWGDYPYLCAKLAEMPTCPPFMPSNQIPPLI
jgi:hypothetical protein